MADAFRVIGMNSALFDKSSHWVSTIRALSQLARLFSALTAAAAGCATVYSLNAALPPQAYWLTGLVLACMTAGACAINDYFDIGKDRVNHPDRPLPSGQLSPQYAWWMAVILFAIAVLASIPLGWYAFILVVVSTVLLWHYSHLLEYSGILGNVLVATIIALLILFGSLAADRPFALLYPTGLLFCYALAREILLDIHDAEGDRLQGVKTIANTWGRPTAFRAVWTLLTLMLISLPIALTQIPISHSLWFAGCISIMVLNFAVFLAFYQRQNNKTAYDQLIFWERLGMILGVMGLLNAAPPV
jgi:geranylgeranylglycerol-phosphate geranylgeranyltransferase